MSDEQRPDQIAPPPTGTLPTGTSPTDSPADGTPSRGRRRRGSGMPNWMIQGRGHIKARVASRGYSHLVSALKIGLPLLAVVLVSLIGAWPYLNFQKAGAKIDKNQTAMVNARYFSRDRQDRPFSMIAKSATEVPNQTNLVDLVRPEAEMTQTNGSWLTITSERGRYNQDDGRLLMLDNVHLLRDDGFEFVTDEAEIDTKSGNAWGDHKVIGQGPSGEIRAEGFVAVDHGKTITFTRSSKANVSNTSGKDTKTGKGNTR